MKHAHLIRYRGGKVTHTCCRQKSKKLKDALSSSLLALPNLVTCAPNNNSQAVC